MLTASGRHSGVSEPGVPPVQYPFPTMDLIRLDDALTYGSRQAKARFAVYIGDLGPDPAARARQILARVPTPDNAVLLAVSPDQRAIEVAYGAGVRGRGGGAAAPRGVAVAASALKEGGLIDGLVAAVEAMAAEITA